MLESGLWIATPFVIQVDAADPFQAKGKAALQALQTSRQNIPVPADSRNLVGPLIEKADVSSWSIFIRHAKSVGLQIEGDRLTLTPSSKMPSQRSVLEGIGDRSLMLPADATPEQIGVALEHALTLCE